MEPEPPFEGMISHLPIEGITRNEFNKNGIQLSENPLTLLLGENPEARISDGCGLTGIGGLIFAVGAFFYRRKLRKKAKANAGN